MSGESAAPGGREYRAAQRMAARVRMGRPNRAPQGTGRFPAEPFVNRPMAGVPAARAQRPRDVAARGEGGREPDLQSTVGAEPAAANLPPIAEQPPVGFGLLGAGAPGRGRQFCGRAALDLDQTIAGGGIIQQEVDADPTGRVVRPRFECGGQRGHRVNRAATNAGAASVPVSSRAGIPNRTSHTTPTRLAAAASRKRAMRTSTPWFRLWAGYRRSLNSFCQEHLGLSGSGWLYSRY